MSHIARRPWESFHSTDTTCQRDGRETTDAGHRSQQHRILAGTATFIDHLLDVGESLLDVFKICKQVTLQRLLESIAWDEAAVRDRCQKIIATEHTHPEAIGTVDETGTAKSGNHTCGVKRQYNGNRGKVENCLNNVALAYTTPSISCLIDAQLYLPREWAEDQTLRKKRKSPMKSRSKPSPRSHWT